MKIVARNAVQVIGDELSIRNKERFSMLGIV